MEVSRGQQHALVLSRWNYENCHDIASLASSRITVRNIAKSLIGNRFSVSVLADCDAGGLLDENLSWANEMPTRNEIQKSVKTLATMTRGGKGHPIPEDELIVYLIGHGAHEEKKQGLFSRSAIFGVMLGDAKRAKDQVSGLYTLDMLYNDLMIEKQHRWRNTLVVLDVCGSGEAFGSSHPSLHLRAADVLKQSDKLEAQKLYKSESFQCIAAAPSRQAGYASEENGTLLHTTLINAWWGNGTVFRSRNEEWVTVAHVVDVVNKAYEARLPEINSQLDPDHAPVRLTSVLGRLSWRGSSNTGEFFAFNKNYTKRNLLEMVPTHAAADCFTGRAAELEEMHQQIAQTGGVAISNSNKSNIAVSATGGVGKTALVAAYAEEHCNEYKWILWVDGANDTSMARSFKQAAEFIPLARVSKESTDAEVFQEMQRFLTEETEWLLVIDGWDQVTKVMKDMMSVQSRRLRGNIITTTRLSSMRDFAGLFGKPILLDVFSEEDAWSYSEKRLPRRSREEELDLRSIAVEVGCMPLALELATAYLQVVESMTARQYLVRLRKDKLRMLSRQVDDDSEDRVKLTYQPSFARAMEFGGQEVVRNIIGALSFVHAEGRGIDAKLLRQLASGTITADNDDGDDDDSFDRALSLLVRLSLVKFDARAKRVKMHLLVQDVSRVVAFEHDQDEKFTKLIQVGSVLKNLVDDDNKVRLALERSQDIAIHGMKCLEWMAKEKIFKDECGWLAVRLYMVWRLSGYNDEAVRAVELGERISYDTFSSKKPLLSAKASTLQIARDFAAAKRVYDEEIPSLERRLHDTAALAAASSNPLSIHTNRDRASSSTSTFSSALAATTSHSPCASGNMIAISVNGVSESNTRAQWIDMATTIFNEALSHMREANANGSNCVEKCSKLSRQAFVIFSSIYGSHHVTIAQCWNFNGKLEEMNRRPKHALSSYKTALRLSQGLPDFGADHPFVADVLTHMSQTHFMLQENDLGISAADRALAIRRLTTPPQLRTAKTLRSLAGAIVCTDPGRAVDLCEEALEIYRNHRRERCEEAGFVVNDLAVAHRNLGHRREALFNFTNAQAILKELPGPPHYFLPNIQLEIDDLSEYLS